MEDEKKKNLQDLQKYLGLGDISDARKAEWILKELEVYGDWGNKVSSYFMSILSGNEGTKTIIPGSQVNAYKSLFINLEDKINKEEK